jgi:formylglycine-generating enzyme required for sulfatase activity
VTSPHTAFGGATGSGPQIGRADLLRLLTCQPPTETDAARDAVLADWIKRLGFEDVAAPVAQTQPKASRTEPHTQEQSIQPEGKVKPRPTPADGAKWPAQGVLPPYWRVVGHALYELPSLEPTPVPTARLEWRSQPITEAVAPPLLPWREVAPRLRSLLEDLGLTREIDLPRAIDRLARGEVAENLPRHRRRQWGATGQIWIDTSTRLIPYLRDFEQIASELTMRLGRSQVELFSGHGPQEMVWHYQTRGRSRSGYRLPPPGTHVLVLGDLGCLDLGSQTARSEWGKFGQRLRSHNCHPLALVPCVAESVSPELRRTFRVHTLAPLRVPGNGRPAPHAIRRLLRLVSIAVRVEPGLLRECRRLVPELADPGLESVVWQQPEFVSRVCTAGTLGPRDVIERCIEEFERLEPKELRSRVLQVFKRWRWRNGERGLGCEVFFEELSRLSAATRELLPAEDSADMEAGWQWLVQAAREYDPEARVPVVDYAYRLLQRDVVQSQLNPAVSESLAQLRGHFEGREVGRSAGPFRIQISQQGNEWVAQRVEEGELGRRELAGSWLATLRARTPAVFLRGGGLDTEATAGAEPWQAVDIPSEGSVRLNPPAVVHVAVRTDCEGVELQLQAKSDVAIAAGRDCFGLWEVTAIPNRRGRPVRVRWRWIPPGTFWMGSPDDEPGRYVDEGPMHLVKLTKGVWMAETPCTQELWQAVMGDNPSNFESQQHPVESVSWLRVQEFLQKLQKVEPRLRTDLPTEAQWEYACRADSATAVYPTEKGSGCLEILGDNNAPGLDSIAWYGGNSTVAEGIHNGIDASDWPQKRYSYQQASSQPVGLKLPNAWGLYDMLGNVWEWCLDRWIPFKSESDEDPDFCGLRSNASLIRVVRGGSWSSDARLSRCAYREFCPASLATSSLGFRLVRLQEEVLVGSQSHWNGARNSFYAASDEATQSLVQSVHRRA